MAKWVGYLFCTTLTYSIFLIYIAYNDNNYHLDRNLQQRKAVVSFKVADANECRHQNAVLYQLAKPFKRFHSNHWFHLGEYYISQTNNISRTLHDTSSSHDIVLIVNAPKVLRYITSMSIFLLALSFNVHGNSKQITILYTPDFPLLGYNENVMVSWTNADRYFWYQNVSDYEKQYIMNVPHSLRSVMTSTHCFMHKGMYGYVPVPSDRWFHSYDEVDDVRRAIRTVCPIDVYPFPHNLMDGLVSYIRKDTSSNEIVGELVPYVYRQRKYQLVVYQRDANRRFLYLRQILDKLSYQLGNDWRIDVLNHDERMHPCLLYTALHQADLFLTTHGFQSVGVLFMKPGATILEVFPYKYFKPSYVMLSAQYGIHHRMIQNQRPTSWKYRILYLISQDICMSYNKCRSFARGSDVEMSVDHMEYVLAVVRDIEARVIGSHNAPYHFIAT